MGTPEVDARTRNTAWPGLQRLQKLLPSFYLWRDETNVIYACRVSDVQNIRDRGEVKRRIAFDKHHLLGACSKNAFQLVQ